MITNNARCTRESKSRFAMANEELYKKRSLFTSILEVNLRKKLIKCYYGAQLGMGLKLEYCGM